MSDFRDFPSGFARVRARDDKVYFGKIGEVVLEDSNSAGHWFTLSIDGEEVIFERGELVSCPAPKGGA